MNDDDEPIIENPDEDRLNKLCRCGNCKEVSRCTVVNDFYVVPDREGLICEKCLQEKIRTGSYPTSTDWPEELPPGAEVPRPALPIFGSDPMFAMVDKFTEIFRGIVDKKMRPVRVKVVMGRSPRALELAMNDFLDKCEQDKVDIHWISDRIYRDGSSVYKEIHYHVPEPATTTDVLPAGTFDARSTNDEKEK